MSEEAVVGRWFKTAAESSRFYIRSVAPFRKKGRRFRMRYIHKFSVKVMTTLNELVCLELTLAAIILAAILLCVLCTLDDRISQLRG